MGTTRGAQGAVAPTGAATPLHVAVPAGGERHAMVGHPEDPSRVDAVLAGIGDLNLGDALVTVEARPAPPQALELVHDRAYLEGLATFCTAGGGAIDADTYATEATWDIARATAGGGLAVIDSLRRAGNGIGFVVARPPGHHALRDRAMGFCLVNNVAVAAATLAAQGERVLIVDWDVHHGNGTQAVFWNDPDVLYASVHEWPLFPWSGAAREVGGPAAMGRTLNVPLPPGATGDVARRAIEELIAPAAEKFGPTWVLVSAGFDAHRADPLADLAWSSGDFAAIARTVAELVPGRGRLVLFLEGGYDLSALRASVTATLGALTQDRFRASEEETSGGPGMEDVTAAGSQRDRALESGGEPA